MTKNQIKLAKLVLRLAEVATDKGLLTYEGELEVGTEVFVEADGEIIEAPDGEYIAEDSIIVVTEGKVTEIKPIEPEQPAEQPAEEEIAPEEPVEENMEEETPAEETPAEEQPAEDEKDSKIAELEATIEQLNARIAELEEENAKLKEANAQQEEALKMSAEVPAKEKVKQQKSNTGLSFNLFK